MIATIPAIRGMLCAVAGVPGRVGLPCLTLEGGVWWIIEYEDAAGALEAMYQAMLHIGRAYRGY